ncbi:MAG TPA: 50S ribosomal protein L35 [Candidatus Paceibacterota bacterium]
MKTNKSYASRLRVTKRGKIIARAAGRCHFNAKERARVRGARGRGRAIEMTANAKSRFLSGV